MQRYIFLFRGFVGSCIIPTAVGHFILFLIPRLLLDFHIWSSFYRFTLKIICKPWIRAVGSWAKVFQRIGPLALCRIHTCSCRTGTHFTWIDCCRYDTHFCILMPWNTWLPLVLMSFCMLLWTIGDVWVVLTECESIITRGHFFYWGQHA